MALLFIGTSEIILIALIILLLFGGRKIPEMMRGLGKGVKSFKDGVNGKDEEVKKEEKKEYSRQCEDREHSVAGRNNPV